MECDICLIEWDSKINIPKIIPCGHTICLSCLKGMLKTSKLRETKYLCPICKFDLSSKIEKEEDLLELVSNYTLLNIVEKLENRKEFLNNSKYKFIK